MSLLTSFGFLKENRIIGMGHAVTGQVTALKTCWWKRSNFWSMHGEGKRQVFYPHLLTFTYQVEGRSYTCQKNCSWNVLCPDVGEEITVYYDPAAPERCAPALQSVVQKPGNPAEKEEG